MTNKHYRRKSLKNKRETSAFRYHYPLSQYIWQFFPLRFPFLYNIVTEIFTVFFFDIRRNNTKPLKVVKIWKSGKFWRLLICLPITGTSGQRRLFSAVVVLWSHVHCCHCCTVYPTRPPTPIFQTILHFYLFILQTPVVVLPSMLCRHRNPLFFQTVFRLHCFGFA